MAKLDKPDPRFPRKAPSKPRRSSGDENPSHAQASPDNADNQEKLAKISGLQAVSALFRRDPNQVIRLYYGEKMMNAVGVLCSQMAKMHKPYRLVDESELEKIAGTVLHGGVVAAAVRRAIPIFDLDAARGWALAGEPLVILDGVGNPHNLGAIARTMAFFGLNRLLISDHPAQAGLSDAAHRVAEGGLEQIEVFRAAGLPRVLGLLRKYYRVVGTALVGHAVEIKELAEDPRPTALVLGNEEHGLSNETLNACEALVTIHGSGLVQSLNVSSTAAILLHQIAANNPSPNIKKPTGQIVNRRQNPPRKRMEDSVRENKP